MSKEPSVEHDYHPKKDRLELTIKRYALTKKSDREDLIKHILRHLDKNPKLAKRVVKRVAKKAKRDKLPKSPIRAARLVEVGD